MMQIFSNFIKYKIKYFQIKKFYEEKIDYFLIFKFYFIMKQVHLII